MNPGMNPLSSVSRPLGSAGELHCASSGTMVGIAVPQYYVWNAKGILFRAAAKIFALK
jgi:hypothetical protein